MIYYETELYHHGVKGQKWGVRRYQNKDGSLTPAGRRRMDVAQRDAATLAETHARLEDMNRRLTRGVKPGTQILVPTDVKKEFNRLVDEYENFNNLFSKKYKSVTSQVITEKGQSYVYELLVDKKTGWGAENKIRLHEQ